MARHFKKDGELQQGSRFDTGVAGGQAAGEPATQRAPQAGAYVPPVEGNPYADDGFEPAPYGTPGDPEPASYAPVEDNPYVGGAAHGAVGMTPERVGSAHAGRAGSGQGVPGAPKKRRRRVPVVVVILVVLAVLVGGGAFLYLNPPIYRVSVDGVEHMVHAGSTLADLVKEGWASPKAGNLIAVDGSVAQEGGGDQFEANLNGTVTSDPTTVVPRHSTVEFSDGNDVDEDYTETTETIAHGQGGQDTSSPSSYYVAPFHVYSDGEDGEQVTRTGKVSGKTVTEVTKQPVDAGFSVFNVNTNGDKVIALTFDDGPWPTTTSEVLDVLKENDAHATFFEIGNQVAENADVVKRIAAEGNQIGSHTWDHASGSGQGVNLTFMTADEQVGEVDKGFKAIEDVLGTSVTHVLRAPGGNYYGSLVETLKGHCTAEVGWNIDTEDWRRPGADKIAEAIMSAQPGNVVLMHDGGGDRSQTVEALKIALPKLREQGYKFLTIDEMLSTYGPSSSN